MVRVFPLSKNSSSFHKKVGRTNFLGMIGVEIRGGGRREEEEEEEEGGWRREGCYSQGCFEASNMEEERGWLHRISCFQQEV